MGACCCDSVLSRFPKSILVKSQTPASPTPSAPLLCVDPACMQWPHFRCLQNPPRCFGTALPLWPYGHLPKLETTWYHQGPDLGLFSFPPVFSFLHHLLTSSTKKKKFPSYLQCGLEVWSPCAIAIPGMRFIHEPLVF